MSKGRWVWCPSGWRVVPILGDKSWLGDGASVPTVSEWEEAVQRAPLPPPPWPNGSQWLDDAPK